MDRPILEQLRAEEADLLRKLEAVRGVLRAYGEMRSVQDNTRSDVELAGPKHSAARTEGNRERVGLERFSEYGRQIVSAAIDAITDAATDVPIPTRMLVDMIEARGLSIRGEDKNNALSALLARSIHVRSNGRRGWTLVSDPSAEALKEKEPPNGYSVGGSEPDGDDVAASSLSISNP